MKIFVMTDIEGVAGVVSHEGHSYGDAPHYEASKRLLTAEVNAGVDGLLDAGVSEVLVADGHGPGGIYFPDLHPRALLLHGRPITRQQMLGPIADYDALAIIGQHAMSGLRTGNQNHTQSSKMIDWMKINGRFVGEIALLALWAGLDDVPVIFLSGDEMACREAGEDVPGILTAPVKKGVSTNVEITLSAIAARDLIRKTIRQAVEAHQAKPVQPVKWPGPYTLEIRYKSTQTADLTEDSTGCERIDDQTVRFRSEELRDVLLQRHRGI